LHRIVEGSSNPFAPLILEGPPGEPFSYGGEGVLPWELAALRLSADPSELWAIAGPAGQSSARLTALLLQSGVFQQIKLKDADGVFAPGDQIGGVAAEPGGQDAWVSIDSPGETSARLARVHADGTVDSEVRIPEAGEGLGHKGQAGAIACPALDDCWVATAQGWLFHLGGNHPRDTAPGLQGPITYRPPDASIPFVAPETFPEDDSGANPPALAPPTPPPAQAPDKVHAALFSHAKARLLAHTTLALTFTLATKSHVRLVAMRRKRQVAQTRRYTLIHGRHTLRLRLNRHAWPTKIDLRVQAIGTVPLVTPGAGRTGPAGGPGVVGTSFHVFDWSKVSSAGLLG
jgi:hypothetical protein